MLEVTKLHHATLTVTDLESTKRFYEGMLGLKQIPRPDVPVPGIWYGCGQQQLHIVVMDQSVPSLGLNPMERGREGRHLAFGVSDYDELKKKLREDNVPFVEGLPELKQLFVEDPSGNLIELTGI